MSPDFLFLASQVALHFMSVGDSVTQQSFNISVASRLASLFFVVLKVLREEIYLEQLNVESRPMVEEGGAGPSSLPPLISGCTWQQEHLKPTSPPALERSLVQLVEIQSRWLYQSLLSESTVRNSQPFSSVLFSKVECVQCAECSVVDGGRSLPISGSAEEGGVAPCPPLHQGLKTVYLCIFCMVIF